MALIDAGAPRMTAATGGIRITDEEVAELKRIALDPQDPSDGYRVVRTESAPMRYKDPAYNRLQAHANLIRAGKVAWMKRLGRWDARARMLNANTCGLFLRYEGE